MGKSSAVSHDPKNLNFKKCMDTCGFWLVEVVTNVHRSEVLARDGKKCRFLAKDEIQRWE